MSILDDGPDELLVWHQVESLDADGNPVLAPGRSPVRVRGLMQPVESAQDLTAGQELLTTYRFSSRTFPAGPASRVRWDGRDWDVMGEPLRRGSSEATAHITVLLRARGGP